MKIADRSVDGFLKRPDAAIRAVLFHGADLGLMRERATQLARTVVADLSDPFRVVELSAKTVREDPARLADEAAAIAFTGGRKIVWVKDAGDGVAEPMRSLLEQAGWDALVIVEGPELASRSKLVELFIDEDGAAAIACYPDREAAIERVVDETLAKHGLDIAPDALAFLSEHLGGDRAVTRAEAEKLALYCAGQKEVTKADAMAAIGDSAAVASTMRSPGPSRAIWSGRHARARASAGGRRRSCRRPDHGAKACPAPAARRLGRRRRDAARLGVRFARSRRSISKPPRAWSDRRDDGVRRRSGARWRS